MVIHNPRLSGKRKGRGASSNPPNRFEATYLDPDPLRANQEWPGAEWMDETLRAEQERIRPVTAIQDDSSRSVLSHNNSPDLGLSWSLNPYRGCEHGCIYCYARPSHEYLGYSAGLDFETRIVVKRNAAALLERALRAPSWTPQPIMLSGNTDCYQPLERKLKLTRSCLEVLHRFRNPVGLITKNALVLRDLELLREMALKRLVSVTITITTLDSALARVLEPRTATPQRRLEIVKCLAEAEIPVGVNVAPVIPALTDHEFPAILRAAHAQGAQSAAYTLLRLPHAVKPLFLEWLEEHCPERKKKILSAIREMRAGELYDSRFGVRMRGVGERSRLLEHWFRVQCTQLGLNRTRTKLDTSTFTRPPQETPAGTQTQFNFAL